MDNMDNTERKLRNAAARLVQNEDYQVVSAFVLSVMSDALLSADPLNDQALRAAAMRREAMATVIEYVSQMAEPINEAGAE